MMLFPPQEMMDAVHGGPISSSDHAAIGAHFRDLVLKRCALAPSDAILDIGCGCGRFAQQLTPQHRGAYDGLDIVLPMVEWCRNNISASHPNFSFHHADLANTLYKGGRGDAAAYTFPFSDRQFDVVVAFSVFTHLVPASAARYAAEIARVLRPGGRALMTFYLTGHGRPTLELPHPFGRCRVAQADNPEAVIGYELDDATTLIERAGLHMKQISFGNWAQHSDGWTYQDAILAVRPMTLRYRAARIAGRLLQRSAVSRST